MSENAEYHQAKDEMAWAHGRLRELQYILDHVEIVESSSKKSSVAVGSTIVVKNSDKTKTYTIVGPHEANPLGGLISNESPLGASFLGHNIGDKISVETPSGTQVFEIIDFK